jgi:hypothetical protein
MVAVAGQQDVLADVLAGTQKGHGCLLVRSGGIAARTLVVALSNFIVRQASAPPETG